MGALFISLLTLVLILISAFVILLVLMQRTSQSGGMGAALGGGAAESAFGSDTNNILTKSTIYSIIAFFIVSLGLFLIYQSKSAEHTKALNPEELISTTALDPDTVAATPVEAVSEAEAILEKAAPESSAPSSNLETSVESAVPVSE